MKDCMLEPCLSPSLGWLSPARVSFSKDCPPHELDPVGEMAECMNVKATANDSHVLKGKDRLAKGSMSDFEFTMAMAERDRAADHGKHMLAADELFFKGKLLPLYVPQYMGDDAEKGCVWQQQLDRKVAHRCSDSDVNLMSSSSVFLPAFQLTSSMSCSPLRHGTMASPPGKGGSTKMLSPKFSKCSSKLRELFGLKRSTTSLLSAAKPSKSSSEMDVKQRKTSTEVMSTFQTWGRAKQLFRSEKSRSKATKSQSSPSKPLLERCDSTVSDSTPSFGSPVISSLLPKQHSVHQQACSKKFRITNVSHSSSSLCSPISRMQRTNRVRDHGDDAFAKVSLQQLRVLREVNSTESYTSMRGSTSARQLPIKEDLKPAVYRAVRRPSQQGFAYYGGSGESSPARKSSGAISPAGNSSQWSPDRLSSGILTNGYNTTCSSCWCSPGRHSISGVSPCYNPGRLSSGIEQLSLSSAETGQGHERLIRARSLERSGSYSPKSLQKKNDQVKALRQRDGRWPAGLERSSSYNNMGSVRVAPVLNVPRVCSLNRSSKTSSYGQNYINCSNGGGGLGLGHFFYTKARSSKVPSSKLQQLRQT